MAEPVMENPFSLPSSRKIQLSKTVQDIQGMDRLTLTSSVCVSSFYLWFGCKFGS